MTHSYTPLTPKLVRAILNLKRANPDLGLPNLDHEVVACASFRTIAEPVVLGLANQSNRDEETMELKVLQLAAEANVNFDRSPAMRSGWMKLANDIRQTIRLRGKKRSHAVKSLVKVFVRELRLRLRLDSQAESELQDSEALQVC